jgi:hypothetical protein
MLFNYIGDDCEGFARPWSVSLKNLERIHYHQQA